MTKVRIKPRILDVVEDDGMWLDKSTMTYYSKEDVEEVDLFRDLEEAADVFKIWGTTEKEYLSNSMDKVHLEMEISAYLKDWEDDEEIGLHLSTDNGCIPIELEDVRDLARHFAEWQKEQFEKNRLAHCDSLSKEDYDRETDFAAEIIEKEHRQPTFTDAINYGMRLQEEQMMKGAVEGVVERSPSGKAISVKQEGGGYYWAFGNEVAKQFDLGDKVKLIVIKED